MKKTASISALIVAFSAVAGLAVLSTACGDDDTTNGGSSSGSTSGTSGASSSGTSGGSSSGTSGGSSSGSSGDTGAVAVAKAQCAHMKLCTPNAYAANYADDAACATAKGSGSSTTYPGLTAPDDAALKACADKLTAQTDCTAASPAECAQKQGTLEDAKACNVGLNQCKSGACSNPDASFQCGTCAVAKKVDEACNPAKFECASDLFCKTDKCAAKIAKDADCAVGDICVEGTTCNGGKCKAPGKIGDTCATAADCYSGLFCGSDTKCAEYTYGKVGDDCDATKGKLCAKSACDQAGTKKCVDYVAEGADCDGLAKQCDPAKDTCDLAGDKKCKANAAPKVCQ